MARTTFATFLIVCPICFFLGILFALLPYDYPLIWSTTDTPASYYDFVEAHLRFLHASPPMISRLLHTVIAVAFCGFLIKLYRPSESNMLFDGASLVLFMCGVIVYIANIVKGLRTATAGAYGSGTAPDPAHPDADQLLGREDSLKVLSASNTILALVLIGVLILQAGQWYAERKEQQEIEAEARREREEALRARHEHAHSHKKKQ